MDRLAEEIEEVRDCATRTWAEIIRFFRFLLFFAHVSHFLPADKAQLQVPLKIFFVLFAGCLFEFLHVLGQRVPLVDLVHVPLSGLRIGHDKTEKRRQLVAQLDQLVALLDLVCEPDVGEDVLLFEVLLGADDAGRQVQ